MNHPASLARLETLIKDPAVVEFAHLSHAIQAYETEQHPLPLPTLAQAMRFRREQMGETIEEISTRSGLHPIVWNWIEHESYEPDIDDARKLHAIGIPADVILQEPRS